MKRLIAAIIFILLLVRSEGQSPVGTWSDHLVYNTARSLAVGTNEIFASTGSSVMIYNKDFSELRKLTRIEGLTETGIKTLGWSQEYKSLVIAYTSTNIDLVKNNTIYNIPDVYRKSITGRKEINRIRTEGKYAYLACSFGIVVIDLNKKEIYDTWKPGNGTSVVEVWDVAIGNNKIYAATGNGVFTADLSNPGLAYFGNWTLITTTPNPTGKYTAAVFSASKLYVNLTEPFASGDAVYVIGSSTSLFSTVAGVFNKSFDLGTNGFTITSPGQVRYYFSDGTLQKTISSYPWGPLSASEAVADNGILWIADSGSGLVKGDGFTSFSRLSLPGPGSNNVISLLAENGKTILCDGALNSAWTQTNRPLQVSVFDDNKWGVITSSTVKDVMRAVTDPDNRNHMFVSAWGGGLLEYSDNILVKQYTELNSPLQNIIPGYPYVRVCGLVYDKNKYLWMTQTEVPNTFKILKPDGTWIVNPLTIEAGRIGDFIITSNNHKWVILPVSNGLYVFDDNNTPEDFTDDKGKKVVVKDSDNKVISNIFSVAEDLEGNIWLGTDQGPVVYYNPEKIFDNDLSAYRIKISRKDGSGLADILLATETITSISVDGANRKWIGTLGSGVYLLSPDGTNLIRNYNEENSPLLSNRIITVDVDNKTGEVWFATSAGVQSVRGDATAGGEKFTGVYSFPNPVRENYSGNVTITGLMSETSIRITDISGNLVYETTSDGGMASWNLKTYNGKRVATGVYLVFCASSDGTKSTITKILVI
jgi:hypothetical protein